MSSLPFPVRSTLDTVGNTAIVELTHLTSKNTARVFLKLESNNPTGSYKDRIARSIIEEAERKGDLKKGMTVVEITGGCMGSALAFVCATKGYRFEAVTSNIFSAERRKWMCAFGAQVHLVPSYAGGPDAKTIPMMREVAEMLCEKKGNCFFVDHYNNLSAAPGYEEIGEELVEQLPKGIDAFCCNVTSPGLLMGVSWALKDRSKVEVVALQGVHESVFTFVPPGHNHTIPANKNYRHIQINSYDSAMAVDQSEAHRVCSRLAKEEGLLVGVATGVNVVAALALSKKLGPGKTVVTVESDTQSIYKRDILLDDV